MKNETGNFNPKRIAQIMEYKKLGKFTIKEIAKELEISQVQAYIWCKVSPTILDRIHNFCTKYNLTFEELYKKN